MKMKKESHQGYDPAKVTSAIRKLTTGGQVDHEESKHLLACLDSAVFTKERRPPYTFTQEDRDDCVDRFRVRLVERIIKGSDSFISKNQKWWIHNIYLAAKDFYAELIGNIKAKEARDQEQVKAYTPDPLKRSKEDREEVGGLFREYIGKMPKRLEGVNAVQAIHWLRSVVERKDDFVKELRAKNLPPLASEYLAKTFPTKEAFLALLFTPEQFMLWLYLDRGPGWSKEFSAELMKLRIFNILFPVKDQKTKCSEKAAKLGKEFGITKKEVIQFFDSTLKRYRRLYGKDVCPDFFDHGGRINTDEAQELAVRLIRWHLDADKPENIPSPEPVSSYVEIEDKLGSPLWQGGGSPIRNKGKAVFCKTPPALIEQHDDDDKDKDDNA